MLVELIAMTQLYGVTVDRMLSYFEGEADLPNGPAALVEFAGRTCYKSYHKPNPATAQNLEYIRNLIEKGHHSPFEHASASFYVVGASRSLLTELERHRHISFSVESQRFCRPEEYPAIPPLIRKNQHLTDVLVSRYHEMLGWYDSLVDELKRLFPDVRYKQIREAARAVLPNMTPVRMVVTGNFRAWRDVISRRIDPEADQEIREFSWMVLEALRNPGTATVSRAFPEAFPDFPEELE